MDVLQFCYTNNFWDTGDDTEGIVLYCIKMSILNSTKIVIFKNFKLFQIALLIVTYGC